VDTSRVHSDAGVQVLPLQAPGAIPALATCIADFLPNAMSTIERVLPTSCGPYWRSGIHFTESILSPLSDSPETTMKELVAETHYAYKGRLLKLRVAKVKLPGGFQTTREIVEHPGAVAVIPLLDSKRILLTRQYRIATGQSMIEIPAGTLEPNENPLACAKRELVEEAGYAAKRWRRLFSCYLAPGYSTEKIHFFLARDLVPRKAKTPKDEKIIVRTMDVSEGLKAIERNQIRDAKTICGLYYLATHRKAKLGGRRQRAR